MISIKTKEDIKFLRENGRILAAIIKDLSDEVKSGITTRQLGVLAEEMISKSGAASAFLGHHGFPSILCASVNREVVHGIPNEEVLKNGDILTLDLGILYKGVYTDMAVTIPIGDVSDKVKKLIETTKKALDLGIGAVKPGARLGDIGFAIQNYVESMGFNVIKELAGHGVGYAVHEEPLVLNYGKPGVGEILKEGMVIAIEPIISAGNGEIKLAANNFTYVTADGSLSAHFEHTVLVTNSGFEILTKF